VVVLAAVTAVALVGYGIFHEPPLTTPRQCKILYRDGPPRSRASPGVLQVAAQRVVAVAVMFHSAALAR
jgi:hypothetical protein